MTLERFQAVDIPNPRLYALEQSAMARNSETILVLLRLSVAA